MKLGENMEFFKRDPIIFLIAGKARSGKSTVGSIIYQYYKNIGEKVVISQVTKYLKKYIEEIIEDKIDDEHKPRFMLQKISSEIIKKELNMPNFFIDRMVEDLKIYSYFFDCVIISDIRFEEEIDAVKKQFGNVVSIGVFRDIEDNGLSEVEKNDITEISLDNYDRYDYKIINNEDNNNLELEVMKILKDIQGRGKNYE